MIYYSKEPVFATVPNFTTLEITTEDDEEVTNYLVVSTNTLTQASILRYIYKNDIKMLRDKLGVSSKLVDAQDTLFYGLPEPLNFLSVFITLISNNKKLNEFDFDECIGILSYISSLVDFVQYIKIPEELRMNIDIPNNSSLYRDSINNFTSIFCSNSIIQKNTSSNSTSNERIVDEDGYDGEQSEEEDANMDWFSDWNVEVPTLMSEEVENNNNTPTPIPTPTPTPTPPIVTEETVNNEVDAYAAIINSFI